MSVNVKNGSNLIKIAGASAGLTYEINKNLNGEIVLTDSSGNFTKVSDENTEYTFTESNGQLVVTGTDGTSESFTLGEQVTKAKVLSVLGYTPISNLEKGTANGVATLDENGVILSSQLPSYVDDVLEYTSKADFPATGESGKIYVDTTTNLTWRWSGSDYVSISPSLALGETSSTAYYGDKGKIAYDHSQSTHARVDATKVESSTTNGNIKIDGTEITVYTHPGSGTNPHGTTKADLGLDNVGNFKAVSTTTQSLSDTEKSNARTNIGAGTYTKPDAGIPESDLDQSIQDALGKIENAIQSINYIEVPTEGWIDNTYVKKTGGTATYNGWKTSDWIEIPEEATRIFIECSDVNVSDKPYNSFYRGSSFVSFACLNEWNVVPYGVTWLRLSCPMTENILSIQYMIEPIDIVEKNRCVEDVMIQSAAKRRREFTSDKDILSFIHFSDIHASQFAYSRVVDYANYYANLFDFIIHTGDYTNSSQADYVDLFNENEASNKPIFYNVIGNHDALVDYETKTYGDYDTAYDHTITKTTRGYQSLGVTFMDASKAIAYYRDFTECNVRLIVLDLYYNKPDQATWLTNLLQDAIDNDIHVITAMHQKTGTITNKVTNFNTVDDYGEEGNIPTFENVIKAKIEAGLKYICNLCGHDHLDQTGYTANGIYNIVVDCSKPGNRYANNYRELDTKTYDCFNVVSIDATQGHLKVTRIGDNANRYMGIKNSYCYDYINKKIVNENTSTQNDIESYENMNKVTQTYWGDNGTHNTWYGSLLLSDRGYKSTEDVNAYTYRSEMLAGDPVAGRLFIGRDSIFTNKTTGKPIYPGIEICDTDAYWESTESEETVAHTTATTVKMNMRTKGTETEIGTSDVTIGNNIAEGSKGNSKGALYIYNKNRSWTSLTCDDTITSDISIVLPNKSGTLVITDDLGTKQDILTAGDNIDITDGVISATGGTYTVATEDSDGLMSSTDKTTLDAVSTTYLPLTGGTVTDTIKGQGTRKGFQILDENGTSVGNLYSYRVGATGATGTPGQGALNLGNSKTAGNAGNAQGVIWMYSSGSGYAEVKATNSTGSAVINLPSTGGTLALDTSSSRLVKENINNMSEDEALKLLDIDVVSFDYKEGFGNKGEYGVIAEDIKELFPQSINVTDNYDEEKFDLSKGFDQPILSVDYRKFVPHLIKMVQIQQNKIEELESKIDSLTK